MRKGTKIKDILEMVGPGGKHCLICTWVALILGFPVTCTQQGIGYR